MFRLALAALGLVFALPLAAAQTHSARLGPQLTLAGGSYSSGGGITIAVELRESAGMTSLCGTWSQSPVQAIFTEDTAAGIVAAASVYLGGDRLVQGLGFLPETAPRLDYAGAPATCLRTARPWQPGDAGRVPRVAIPRQSMARNTGSDKYGKRVSFRQDGPAAMEGALDLAGLLRRNTGPAARLGPDPARAGGRYTSGGGLQVAAELRDLGGRAHLCGLWANTPGQSELTRPRGRHLLRAASILLDGKVVGRNLAFLRQAPPRTRLAGALATCTDLGRPWRPALARARLGIDLPETIVFRSRVPEGLRLIRFLPD